MALVWDKALYDQMYRLPMWQWGVRNYPRVPYGHYSWFGAKRLTQANLAAMQRFPGFAQVKDVAIVGGGFGWSADLLVEMGINAISIEVSPYVLATKDQSEEQEIRDNLVKFGFDPDNLPTLIGPDYNTPVDPWAYWLRPDGRRSTAGLVIDEDLSTNTSRRNVRQALGNKLDAIVSEFALDSYAAGDEAGPALLVERCESLRPNPACPVIHIIQPNENDVFLNWKTAAEWRTFLDGLGFNDHRVVDMKGSVL